ncbi:MAG: glycine--tRNA ligase [Patescibacteria group bacterium]
MENISQIISLTKRRGFIFQSSEIYGGVGAIWDFGPLGVEMKNAIKNLWWKKFVMERQDVVGMEGSIIMNPKVWEASGHINSFTDPLIECKKCNARFRADLMGDKKQCQNCKSEDFTESKDFNLMFKTFLGPVETDADKTYLRPETAQSMFTNFKLILDSSRQKVPFGIAQIGKAFRNEITTGGFIFRSREFEIAEIEYFVKPETDEKIFEEWLNLWEKFYIDIGINKNKLRRYEHSKEALSHYSKRTVDVEYEFPFGWSELAGVANRTDYDLSQHQKFSGASLEYFDSETNTKYLPFVIEPTMGIERIMLALLVDGFNESDGNDGREKGDIVLKLNSRIAPVQVAIFPLLSNKDELIKKSQEVLKTLLGEFRVDYDASGSIGRRYRRQDEIGTPYCLTIDFESLKNDDLTVRDRDTMKQERIKISELKNYLKTKISNS